MNNNKISPTIPRDMGCGGCAAKLPPKILHGLLRGLPVVTDDRLLVGFDTSDDGAVFKLTEDLAIIQTMDFFPPMVDDPELFGKIAAANALSDIYAMGGQPITAMNIVCFPQEEDTAILAAILRGGAEKIAESGAVLCGGHSISDSGIKYGLSVSGTVHPDKVKKNNTCKIEDRIILTKPLGVGLITASHRAGRDVGDGYAQATRSMQTLNKYAFEVASKYTIHACTDVTGFGFLGHLNEMTTQEYSIQVDCSAVQYIPQAKELAEMGHITGGGKNNRNFLEPSVEFVGVPTFMEEILFDPQTSGGLLLSVPQAEVDEIIADLSKLELAFSVVATVVPRESANIIVQ
ncbi:MAG: selenide, water dikinase SelD [Oscillospiraceae bacterium]|nr:selenide, water dikinase SelD [Oscillospiraceae bacterium]